MKGEALVCGVTEHLMTASEAQSQHSFSWVPWAICFPPCMCDRVCMCGAFALKLQLWKLNNIIVHRISCQISPFKLCFCSVGRGLKKKKKPCAHIHPNPLCTLPLSHIWSLAHLACTLVNRTMPHLPNVCTADIWYCCASHFPWDGTYAATGPASSIKSLLTLSPGQWVPITKSQWFYMLFWVITGSFSCLPCQTLPHAWSPSQGWAGMRGHTLLNICHSNQGCYDSLGQGWILHCGGTCAPVIGSELLAAISQLLLTTRMPV